MQSIGPSGKIPTLYRPILARASMITPVPHFAGDTRKAATGSSAKPGLWLRFVRWTKALAARLKQWFSVLCKTKSNTTPSQAIAPRKDTTQKAGQDNGDQDFSFTTPPQKHNSQSRTKPSIRNPKQKKQGSSTRRESDIVLGPALETSRRRFMHRIHPNETEAQRAANAVHLGSDLIEGLSRGLSRKYEILDKSLFQDVQDISRELSTIAYNTARAQTFNELTPTNQDRMINLIAFTLQHSEPLIHTFGVELARSIGLSSETIQKLQHRETR